MSRHVPEAYAPLMTVDETAEYLRVSRRQVYVLISRGDLPAVLVGSRVRLDPQDVRDSLRTANEQAP